MSGYASAAIFTASGVGMCAVKFGNETRVFFIY